MESVDSISYVDDEQKVVGGALLEINDTCARLTVKLDIIAAPQEVIRKFQEDTLRFWLAPPNGGEDMALLKNLALHTYSEDPQVRAKRLVSKYIDVRSDPEAPGRIYEVHVLYFAEVGPNWKCLLTTTLDPDARFELCYDSTREETSVSIFKRTEEFCISDNSTLV